MKLRQEGQERRGKGKEKIKRMWERSSSRRTKEIKEKEDVCTTREKKKSKRGVYVRQAKKKVQLPIAWGSRSVGLELLLAPLVPGVDIVGGSLVMGGGGRAGLFGFGRAYGGCALQGLVLVGALKLRPACLVTTGIASRRGKD
jgi:hypothetical protein